MAQLMGRQKEMCANYIHLYSSEKLIASIQQRVNQQSITKSIKKAT